MTKLADWVKESVSGTPGTGTITLGGAVTGFCRFQDAFVTGNVVYYSIQDGNNREEGIGTLTSGTPWTLARTTVLRTISSGTYSASSPTAISLTSSAIVGIAAAADTIGIVVGTAATFNGAYTSSGNTMGVTDTIRQNTEGFEVVTVSYTPKFADSLLQVSAQAMATSGTSTVWLSAALFVDSTANALKAISVFTNSNQPTQAQILSLYHEELSGNTTARTYKFRIGSSSGTTYVNGSTSARLHGGGANTYIKINELRQ